MVVVTEKQGRAKMSELVANLSCEVTQNEKR